MKTLKRFSLALVGAVFLLSGCAKNAVHESALAGEIGQLKAYVEGGGNIEDRGDKNWVSGLYHYDGKTPLHMAVEGNQPEAVRYLTSKGADIEAKTSAGETPLLLSAKAGNMAMFDLLLSSAAQRFATDDNGNTALLLALEGLKDEPEKSPANRRCVDSTECGCQCDQSLAAHAVTFGSAV